MTWPLSCYGMKTSTPHSTRPPRPVLVASDATPGDVVMWGGRHTMITDVVQLAATGETRISFASGALDTMPNRTPLRLIRHASACVAVA